MPSLAALNAFLLAPMPGIKVLGWCPLRMRTQRIPKRDRCYQRSLSKRPKLPARGRRSAPPRAKRADKVPEQSRGRALTRAASGRCHGDGRPQPAQALSGGHRSWFFTGSVETRLRRRQQECRQASGRCGAELPSSGAHAQRLRLGFALAQRPPGASALRTSRELLFRELVRKLVILAKSAASGKTATDETPRLKAVAGVGYGFSKIGYIFFLI